MSASSPALAARSAAQIFSGLSDDEVFLLGPTSAAWSGR